MSDQPAITLHGYDIDVKGASSPEEAYRRLDAFREAVLPEWNYGIVIHRPDAELDTLADAEPDDPVEPEIPAEELEERIVRPVDAAHFNPDAALFELRLLCDMVEEQRARQESGEPGTNADPWIVTEDAYRMTELVRRLDAWMRARNNPPREWGGEE